MFRQEKNESGFTLIEVMISLVIVTIGLLASLAALAVTMAANQTSQEDMIARQVASEAMEGIFNARNSSQLAFSAINNTSVSGGIFEVGALPLLCAGPDGIIGTADDSACYESSGTECPNSGVECLDEPGPSGLVGGGNDRIVSLNNFTRTISITPLSTGTPPTVIPTLVQVTITINYTVPDYGHNKAYVLVEYISQYH
jgi:prepilin-type N-terminal cleavage/methylation domain-containing protein